MIVSTAICNGLCLNTSEPTKDKKLTLVDPFRGICSCSSTRCRSTDSFHPLYNTTGHAFHTARLSDLALSAVIICTVVL